MKEHMHRIIPFVLAVLCLLSMSLPITALSLNETVWVTNSDSTCTRCGGTLGSVVCNDWYNFTHYYRNPTQCYAIWNDRCTRSCSSCSAVVFVSHAHSSIYGHNFVIDNPDIEFLVCSNGDCHETCRRY